ncbi:precorrin-3B C(17)-methyltransferase [Pleurocapsa sp. PCC 7319]|uniref:precorrin-3B C(17)-methyltransferase n=1 Tax=Pleurocapsa sp. PCC 7319 TaxID=118161 RepID=UPI000348B676|nr:precorrin-3B C(17)-methyltransferase [Pleurocapsa sp. PCC 7319]
MDNSCFNQFSPLAAIATHTQAAQVLKPLSQNAEIQLWLPSSVEQQENSQHYDSSLKQHLESIWTKNRALIFCLATGAVVRLIAPLLQNKSQDPAVVVIDAQGDYVISLCSGHQGKADLLAQLVASQIGATAIITGASHNLSLPAIDVLGFTYGWRKGSGDWLGVMSAIARQESVQVIQESGSTLWQEHLPEKHPFNFNCSESQRTLTKSTAAENQLTNDSQLKNVSPQARIWISHTKKKFAPRSDFPEVQWHPKVLWIGVGCERGTSRQLIETAIDETCRTYHLSIEAIAGIASIDLKADETGILEVCRRRNLAFKTFDASQLNQVEVPTPSKVVAQEVGTPSVAEAAAILVGDILLVSKQIFKSDSQPGAVTVAVSQSNLEYIGRTGKLYLVGIGPGNLGQITPAAQTAIVQADVVIGYSLYTDLIKSLHRPGQIIESSPITQEQQRAQRAIELAQWGLTVAVVSSGDCGIYGMAGLVLEELQATGWQGKTPQVQVFPGISALQSAASRVGAPLMHDFCAISLSDLLTSWEVIEKRLTAAASGDFITALYNPRSQKRQQQIIIAQEIFSQHRQPDTPVAIVHGAYREDEQVILTTLDKMLDQPIDMLTTVIIGNTNTRNYANWMITPRGYFDQKNDAE